MNRWERILEEDKLFDIVVGMVSASLFVYALAKVSHDLELNHVLPYRVGLAAQEASEELVINHIDEVLVWLDMLAEGDGSETYELIMMRIKPLFDRYDANYEICV